MNLLLRRAKFVLKSSIFSNYSFIDIFVVLVFFSLFLYLFFGGVFPALSRMVGMCILRRFSFYSVKNCFDRDARRLLQTRGFCNLQQVSFYGSVQNGGDVCAAKRMCVLRRFSFYNNSSQWMT